MQKGGKSWELNVLWSFVFYLNSKETTVTNERSKWWKYDKETDIAQISCITIIRLCKKTSKKFVTLTGSWIVKTKNNNGNEERNKNEINRANEWESNGDKEVINKKVREKRGRKDNWRKKEECNVKCRACRDAGAPVGEECSYIKRTMRETMKQNRCAHCVSIIIQQFFQGERTSRWVSRWELKAARATSVRR